MLYQTIIVALFIGLTSGHLFHKQGDRAVQGTNSLKGVPRVRSDGTLRSKDMGERTSSFTKKEENYVTQEELQEVDDRLSAEITAVSAMLDSFMHDVMIEMEKLWDASGNQEGAIAKLQEVPVHFYAYEYNRKHPGKNEVIKMSQVRSNIGDGYSTSTGKFTCPVSGLYQFNYFVYGGSILRVDWAGYHQVGVNLMKDNQKINLGSTTIYLYGKEGEEWSNLHGDNSAILQCNKGEELWLASPEFANQGTNRIDQANFSGYLIRETS